MVVVTLVAALVFIATMMGFYDCDVPESVWEIVKHEDVPGVVVKKLVDYVMWAVLG